MDCLLGSNHGHENIGDIGGKCSSGSIGPAAAFRLIRRLKVHHQIHLLSTETVIVPEDGNSANGYATAEPLDGGGKHRWRRMGNKRGKTGKNLICVACGSRISVEMKKKYARNGGIQAKNLRGNRYDVNWGAETTRICGRTPWKEPATSLKSGILLQSFRGWLAAIEGYRGGLRGLNDAGKDCDSTGIESTAFNARVDRRDPLLAPFELGEEALSHCGSPLCPMELDKHGGIALQLLDHRSPSPHMAPQPPGTALPARISCGRRWSTRCTRTKTRSNSHPRNPDRTQDSAVKRGSLTREIITTNTARPHLRLPRASRVWSGPSAPVRRCHCNLPVLRRRGACRPESRVVLPLGRGFGRRCTALTCPNGIAVVQMRAGSELQSPANSGAVWKKKGARR
ncbi:hypothetical protein B0H17DRAFT_1140986 [Mycena rosella]|uniref:Uncharacterized protein n=1 Tax=Mycena rosella TaxID=1033263 RepID=A0AAD7D0P0_MYCRO|nr:hypothetical protein B0H17DRAFT_1140986 [Mycena rosella]